MSNSINITKCDNQLILIAVNNTNTNDTVEICNIKSGNSNTVDVTINIEEGSSVPASIQLNGLDKDLSGTYSIQVPAGDYSLVYVGVNWGGPYNFEFTMNKSEPFKLLNNPAKPLNGAIWDLGNLNAIKFSV
jgi:hypothetical protein